MGGEIINKVTAKKNGAVQIVIVAIMCAVMVLLCCGTAWGIAFAERNKRTGEPVNGAGFYGGSGELTCPGGLDATATATCLENYLKKKNNKSPFIGQMTVFVNISKKYNVNPAFVLAIAGQESTFGFAYINKAPNRYYNFCNRGHWGGGDFIPDEYSSFEEGTDKCIGNIRTHYLDDKWTTLDDEFRLEYCGTYEQNCREWLPGVTKFFNEMLSECPSVRSQTSLVYTANDSKNAKKVCIDAGHNSDEDRRFIGEGAEDTEGANNLKIALKVEQALKEAGYDVFMTRKGATYNGENEKRKIDVITSGCGISISIHSNAGGGSGTQTYICNQKYQLRWDVDPEAVNLISQAYKPFIVKTEKDNKGRTAIQYKIGNDGSKLAQAIHPEVVKAFMNRDGGIHQDTDGGAVSKRMAKGGVDQLNNVPLNSDAYGYASSLGMACRVDVPAIILEVGFHDNPIEVVQLKDPAKQTAVANAIVAGVKKYFGN